MTSSFSWQAVALILKSALALIANLYVAKLISANLGVDSYGVLVVILGITGVFVFIGEIFSSASLRFLSANKIHDYTYTQGEVWKSLRQIFIALSLFCALLIYGISEFSSVFNLGSDQLIIKEGALSLKILSIHTFFKVLSIPLVSLMYARLKIVELAIILIIEPILKILSITIIVTYSELFLSKYVWTISSVSIAIYLILYCYNKNHIYNISNSVYRNKILFYKIFNYTIYNGIGGVAVTIRTNGSTLILNKILGPEFTAFHGIATSISSIGAQINTSVISVLKPRIIKRYNNETAKLADGIGSLLIASHFIIMALALPIALFGADIIGLWIKEIPSIYLQVFGVMVFTLLVEAGNLIIVSVIQADGDIKSYQLKVSIWMIVAVPVGGLLLWYLKDPIIFYLILMITSVFSLIPRLNLLNKKLFKHRDVSLKKYFKTIVFLYVLLATGILCFSMSESVQDKTVFIILILLFATVVCMNHIKNVYEVFK